MIWRNGECLKTTMEEPQSELRLMPCECQDETTQRCRLPVLLMDALNIRIGSCVKIHTKDTVYLCAAWPRHDGLHTQVQLDSTVYVRDVTKEGLHQSLQKQIINATKDLQVGKVSKLSQIDVTLVCATVADTQRFNKFSEVNDTAGHTSPTLRKYILNILRNIFIAKNAIVDCRNWKLGKLYKFSYLVINAASPGKANACGVVNPSTDVCVKHVVSKERFEQKHANNHFKLGGLWAQSAALADFVSFPASYADLAIQSGLSWPRGLLVHGPPGCGKTTLVKDVTSRVNAHIVLVSGSEMFASRPGEGEDKLRELFQKAGALSQEGTCVLFIDELDSVCPKQGRGGGVQEHRMVAQLGTLMDSSKKWTHLVVVGATSRPQLIDPVLRRPGRFEKEIFVGIPSSVQRKDIVECLLTGRTVGKDVDVDWLVEVTPGFVGADLRSLIDQADYRASTDPNSPRSIQPDDLQVVLHTMVPSTQRGSDVLVDHRPVNWSDIGGLTTVKQQIKQAVEWPLKHSDAFKRLGIKRPSGILLYGPPGCAKTLLVRAAATAAGSTFLAVSGAQLHSPFVGDAEKKLTEVFKQARAGAPAILFLDEVDAVMGKRSEGARSSNAHERVLSTLLNEMDGVGVRMEDVTRDRGSGKLLEGDCARHLKPKESSVVAEAVDNSSVLVVAATNRPDMIDAALLRPGRLDRIIYVPPPDLQTRHEILKVHTRNMPLESVDLESVSMATDGFTGADLENLCREAALRALTLKGLDADHVTQSDFSAALAVTGPSLTKAQLAQYASLCLHHRVIHPKEGENTALTSTAAGFDFSHAAPLSGTFTFTENVS